MIKAVIFDYFGVVSSDEYWDFFGEEKQKDGQFHRLANKVNIGELEWMEFKKQLIKTSSRTMKDIDDMYGSHQINRSIVGFVGKLKKHYKTALLTNAHHSYLYPILKETGLDRAFDKVIISSEVGAIKPMPRIFKIAARQLGCAPPGVCFN